MAEPVHQHRRSIFRRGLYCMAWFLACLVFGVVVEWLVMTIYYPEQGANRSLRLMEAELSYLENTELIDTAYGGSLIGALIRVQQSAYHFISDTLKLEKMLSVLAEPSAVRVGFSRLGLLDPKVYAVTTLNMIQVMTLRVVVIVLSLPVYVIVMTWALGTGLTQRAIRRYQFRNESSFVFHHAKRIKLFAIVVPISIYLAWPNELSPVWLFGPCALIYGASWFVMASKFKRLW